MGEDIQSQDVAARPTSDGRPAPRAQKDEAAELRSPPTRPRRGDENEEPPAEKRPPWYKRPLPAGIFIVVVITVCVTGVLWWRHSQEYESTDDAYVDVVSQRVSPQVAGRVARVLVNDNHDVEAGQLLFEIDPADFQARLNQATAAVTQAQAQAAQAEAQRTIRAAELDQARAAATAVATGASNAASDMRRLEQASAGDAGVASAQQLEHTRAEARSTAAQQNAAEKAVAAAQAQLALVSRQIEAAQAAVKSAEAQAALAKLSLSYATVRASVAGRIANKTVAVGDLVQPGSDVMAIVPHEVYVTADFKETQLARVRRGQPATVKVDAYPDLELHGHVDSVQPATGNAFIPLPAENAAGNWVKVVQRVPVKIVIDDLPNDPDRRLGPGMSAEVKVGVTEKAVRSMETRRRRS